MHYWHHIELPVSAPIIIITWPNVSYENRFYLLGKETILCSKNRRNLGTATQWCMFNLATQLALGYTICLITLNTTNHHWKPHMCSGVFTCVRHLVSSTLTSHFNAVLAASGWAGWALAHPEFGSSVNPIPSREGRLCPPHYCLPGFENLAASLTNI